MRIILRVPLLDQLVLTLLLPAAAAAQGPTISKQFGSTQVAVSAFTPLTFLITNATASSFTNLGFIDNLPGGLSIFPTAIPTNQCAGTLTATPGSTAITLTNGSLAPHTQCMVTVFIQGDTVGLKNNTVNGSGDLAGQSAFDSTTVIAPVLTKSFSPVNLTVGQTNTLTLTLTNNVVPPVTFGAVSGFVDNLPLGMAVTALGGNTCTGTVTNPDPSTIIFAQSGGDTLATGSCTITATVKVSIPGMITNTATGNRALSGQNPSASVQADPPVGSFQVRYASNLTSGESLVNLINNGANGAAMNGPGFGGAAGNICVNAYTFSPDEQLVACCSCLITPNGLASMSVGSDLLSNTLTGVRPNSVVVKLVNTGAGPDFTRANCNNSAALAGSINFPLAAGLVSFATTIHPAVIPGNFSAAETPFLNATLSLAELASITGRCTNIIGNGSGFGICNGCRNGGAASLGR